ncbi:MFS transporter [Legionella sp. MW5194]|uniref:MFS transporter n=1 Tax=Legionella sp. MW5194 TaxID=2662448 RepID=UPI00193D18FD|nr:MFS transporter [Legionella sp. MW5194]QRN04176.1 MFS transporter [Legionella sp. MW5194]
MALREAYLLKKRTFLPLFITQFFGAFNDNAFKLSMLTLISYHLASSQSHSEFYQALSGGLFILPFFLFSATSGQLADRYDKALMTRLIKVFELVLMIIGSLAFSIQSMTLLLLVLMGMGIHSTFFGPIKYAILPDHLAREELLSATALIEASTFIAILLGTTLGALTIGTTHSHVGYAVALVLSAAVAGMVASWFIPPAPGKVTVAIDWHVWRATCAMMRQTFANRITLPAILTISWFWLIGAVITTKLPDYTHFVLRADTSVFALFLAMFSIGIALGSLTIGRMLQGAITLKYVPPAMLLLSFFAMNLYWVTPTVDEHLPLQSLGRFLLHFSNWPVTLDFFLFAFSAGLFIVPLYTFIQVSCPEHERARTVAANNILNALAMVMGSVILMVLIHFKMSIAFLFLLLGALNAVAAIVLWRVIRRH